MIGSGSKIVDIYLDPLCPYCKLFEQNSGPMLFTAAQNGTATIRVHPLAVLNRYSNGTAYSTRASAVLTAVAAHHPDRTVDFLSSMFSVQPHENTTGLTDEDLMGIASKVGASLVGAGDEGVVDLTPYRTWVEQHTQQALTGPLPTTTQLEAVQAVPTVIVNGFVYDGNSNETERFATFFRDH